MSIRAAQSIALIFTAVALLVLASAVDACSSDAAVAPGTARPNADATTNDAAAGNRDAAATNDAGPGDKDAGPGDKDAGTDASASCTDGKVIADAGETCIGFGSGTPCNDACGLYGYRCFGGHPPGLTGCLQVNASALLGETYCCATNACVAEPDQDAMCAGFPGKPHRFQCPPTADGGTVAAPLGCVAAGSGGTALEQFYCCP